MPKRRFEKLDPEMRSRILQAAALEFGTHGFSGASLNRIVEQAGISKGSMYYYFEDKEDLFNLVLNSLEERSTEITRMPPEDLTPETFWPSIEMAFRAWLQIVVETPWIQGFLQMFSELLRNPPTEGPLVAWHAKMQDRRFEFLRRGQELGMVRTDLSIEFLGELLTGFQMLHGRFFTKRSGELPLKVREEMPGIMVDLARRILSPAPFPVPAPVAAPAPAPTEVEATRPKRRVSTKKKPTRKS